MGNVLKSIAMGVKDLSDDVYKGMTGNKKGFAKKFGEKALRSNMSASQLDDVAKQKFIRQKAADTLGTAKASAAQSKINGIKLNMYGQGMDAKKVNNLIHGTKWGEGIGDKVVGNVLANNSKAYKIGDALGGGARDAYRSYQKKGDINTALKAGFTKKVNGESKIRMGRVAGAAVSASAVGRVATGGGLYRDRYGRTNIPGLPFI